MSRNNCKDLTISRKTSKSFQLNFKKDHNPVDITGWTVYFTVKDKMEETDNNAKIKKDITSHLDATGGRTLIELSPVDTDLKGNMYYDIKYKDPIGNIGILFYWMIKFRETVTTRG